MSNTTFSSDNSITIQKEIIIKMSTSVKIKAINKKVSKTKFNILWIDKLLKFLPYHQEMLVNIYFSLKKMFYEKKTCIIDAPVEKFEHSLLEKELKNQTSVAEKRYQKVGNSFESNKTGEDKTKNKRSCDKSNLVYHNHSIEEFAKSFHVLKRNDFIEFKNKLELFFYNSVESQLNNEDQIKDLEKRKTVFTKA